MGFDGGVSKIVVTGDFLRPIETSAVPAQTGNVHWLGHLLRRPLQFATGYPVDVRTWGSPGTADIGDPLIRAVYDDLDAPVSLDGWAKIFRDESPSAALDILVSSVFGDALVIGFELPPIVEMALQRAGIPFLTVAVHPARYLDDIVFGMRCSDATVQAALRDHAIPEYEFEVMAGLQAAAAHKRSFFRPAPNSLVIVGQVPGDASCISGGRFASLEHYRSRIAAVAAGREVVYFKPHPLAGDKTAATRMRDDWGLPIEVTDESIYYLMAHPHVTAVLALSSSVGTEARYFGKEATLLLQDADRLWRSGDPMVPDAYMPQREDWLTPDFWREVLAEALPVTRMDGMRLDPKANRLRLSVGAFWGYNRTDTDLLVDLGTKPGTAASDRMQVMALAAAQGPFDALTARVDHLHKAESVTQALAADLKGSVDRLEGLLAAAQGPIDALTARVDHLHEAQSAVQALAADMKGSVDRLDRALAAARVDHLREAQSAVQVPIRDLRARLEALETYLSRKLTQRWLFRRTGRPIRPLRRTLFHSNGKPRGIFRRFVIAEDGMPKPMFRQWMTSPEYLRLPKAWRGTAVPVAAMQWTPQPAPEAEAWRSVLHKDHLEDSELDALMDRIRVELRAEAAQ